MNNLRSNYVTSLLQFTLDAVALWCEIKRSLGEINRRTPGLSSSNRNGGRCLECLDTTKPHRFQQTCYVLRDVVDALPVVNCMRTTFRLEFSRPMRILIDVVELISRHALQFIGMLVEWNANLLNFENASLVT
jgi:hypothetical protein